MKCPKCGYLGFEHVERCRNCGYEFSLNQPRMAPDLAIRSPLVQPSLNPLADLALSDRVARPSTSALDDFAPGAEFGESTHPALPTPELPLFGGALDDRPLITKPSAPRTPLAVRRATPDVPRLRSEARPASVDLLRSEPDFTSSPERTVRSERVVLPSRTGERERQTSPPGAVEYAAASTRIAAGALDLALLAAIDALVLYFTLQISGLGLSEVGELPWIPLLAFLLLQNVAYLIVFTAGGQTLGQMALGIKVVPITNANASPGLHAAIIRTSVYLALAVPAGLGLLTVLFARDGRGLHDRIAATGVVRSAA